MSSRFVSAGVVDATGVAKVTDEKTGKTEKTDAEKAELTARQAEWLAVERRLDEERKKREAARTAAPTSSLYDMLQANRDAKQAAFEEAAKLSNQFRALDEDEIAFLDALRERERAEAERVKRETAEGIEAFRKAQTSTEAATAAADTGERTASKEDISWSIRKRKRTERAGFPNLKRRADDAGPGPGPGPTAADKAAKADAKKDGKTAARENEEAKPVDQTHDAAKPPAESPAESQAQPLAKPPSKPKLLVAYASDSDSD